MIYTYFNIGLYPYVLVILVIHSFYSNENNIIFFKQIIFFILFNGYYLVVSCYMITNQVVYEYKKLTL